jgi:hypothetical protein
MLKRDPDTGLILRNATTGILCNTCCTVFIPEYGAIDCCAFLNPSPPEWETTPKEYFLYECVSYGGFGWISLIDNNIGHTPVLGGSYWQRYRFCATLIWDDLMPMYGGPTKTPKYYAVSAIITGTNYSIQVYLKMQQILYGNGCIYNTTLIYGHITCSDGIETITEAITDYGSIFTVYENTYHTLYFEWFFASSRCGNKNDLIQLDPSIYGNYTGLTYLGDTISFSWRPLDCDYVLWDITTPYNYGDCVTWSGKYYKCISSCISIEPPNITYWDELTL